jgi:hypothetical protein
MAVEGLACGALNPIRATVVFETVPSRCGGRLLVLAGHGSGISQCSTNS